MKMLQIPLDKVITLVNLGIIEPWRLDKRFFHNSKPITYADHLAAEAATAAAKAKSSFKHISRNPKSGWNKRTKGVERK